MVTSVPWQLASSERRKERLRARQEVSPLAMRRGLSEKKDRQ
jgi:hypothetical protein